MKLVANRFNQTHLSDLLPKLSETVEVDHVLAAIAYGDNSMGVNQGRKDVVGDLIKHSVDNKLRLDLWMRYDETVPVAVPLLERLLKHQSDNIFTRFVPDCLHAKVIWWRGYGAYIGSANHTGRGWLTNIEAGIFVEEDELQSQGMDLELEQFFDELRALDNTIPISEDYVRHMEALAVLNRNANAVAKKKRQYSVWDGPAFVAKAAAFDRAKQNFQREWNETLGYMQNIQRQVIDYRPSWLNEDIPSAWQVDQFLHAYYYNRVSEGLRKPYEEYYQRNKADPSMATKQELQWWQSLPEAPSNELDTLEGSAPRIRELLREENVLKLTDGEVQELFWHTHATMDHMIKVPLAELGKPESRSLDTEARLPLFTQLVLRNRNRKGWDVRKLLHYTLYGGDDGVLWERLYNAGRDPEYKLSRYGLNSIGEVVGWARPELVPPRNGRTSKALRALGYDVRLY
jgi:hypothetical protein